MTKSIIRPPAPSPQYDRQGTKIIWRIALGADITQAIFLRIQRIREMKRARDAISFVYR